MVLKTFFVIVSQASVLLPVITGGIRYRKLTPEFRLLFYFFLLGIGFEIQATATSRIFHNNMPGLHLFTIVQFLALSKVFYEHVRGNKTLRRLILVNGIFAFIIAVADALFINGIMRSNTFSSSYTAISIVVYTLIYFYRLFRGDTQTYQHNPMFWFAVACLTFFANNIYYFMLRDNLLQHAKNIEILGFIVFVSLNLIAHILYAQSFRCFGKWKRKS